jgi:hypothetical protein
MQKDDLILISVDDHIIEPPDMFAGHLPKKYETDAPQLVHQDDGADVWAFRGIKLPNVALNAVAGRPKEEYGTGGRGPAVVAGDQGVPRREDRAVRGRHRVDPVLPRPP